MGTILTKDLLEQIVERIKLNELIGETVGLKITGRTAKGLCPFHKDEKTLSLSVTEMKGLWHCFGCHKGGNAVNWIMELKKIPFTDAVLELADRLGIVIDGIEREDTRLYDVNLEVAKIYYKTLSGNKKALDYVKNKRKFNGVLIKEFKIGYSDGKQLEGIKKKFSADAIYKAGIFDRDGGDKMTGRLVFPIFNTAGKIAGFTGRLIVEGTEEAKYKNTPNNSVYNKSKILYGLNQAIPYIKNEGEVIIVEGQMDVLRLWDKGFKNVCALSGTRITSEQVKLLKRYTNKFYMITDGDEAGVGFYKSNFDTLVNDGADIKIVTLDKKEDPDSYLLKYGEKRFKECLGRPKGLISYLLSGWNEMSNYDKNETLTEIIISLSKIKSKLHLELYLIDLEYKTGINMVMLKDAIKKSGKMFFKTIDVEEEIEEFKNKTGRDYLKYEMEVIDEELKQEINYDKQIKLLGKKNELVKEYINYKTT